MSLSSGSTAQGYSELTTSSGSFWVHKDLSACINNEVLPSTGVDRGLFWEVMGSVIKTFTQRNSDLLSFRDSLQQKIDSWYIGGCREDQSEFLRKIGYLVASPCAGQVRVSTSNVDPEIFQVAAPQLVVPVDNDRFVVNAVNSRWGSLSAAVSSTDVIGKTPSVSQVRSFILSILDKAVPLSRGTSWAEVKSVTATRLGGSGDAVLRIVLQDGSISGLWDPRIWIGWALNSVFLKHHGLHIWVQTSPADGSIVDAILESALTAILDLEDSVAAVDAQDKAKAYANWAKVMRGNMSITLAGGEKRSLRPDVSFRRPDGSATSVPGCVLSLVRNVGIHCRTNMLVHADNTEVYEGLVDAVVTIVAALADLRGTNRNSRAGSVYIVKPKLHGPEEVRFACDVFAHIERLVGLPLNTVKIGIMDEERRTSVNLLACIDAAKERVFFINTGFLDRTGDEIHTCMRGGPVLPKSLIKTVDWISAYEQLNVINGALSGFFGKAQVGKGMWAEPDAMKAMMDQKISQLKSGASTAWVPSPTAATLHAIHYHEINVGAVQRSVDCNAGKKLSLEKALLRAPIMTAEFRKSLTKNQITDELNNNAQGVLGYVVRWVDLGVGCSKVPDIRHVGLMEDLATLRISSQHIANWLLHGIVSEAEVVESFKAMAHTVDGQNAKDKAYRPMAPNFDSNLAFQAALQLVKDGTRLPNGYSIAPLMAARRAVKNRAKSLAAL